MMIRLLHLCIFLSLNAIANCANADIPLNFSLDVLTLNDHTNLTCCHQNISQCSFYTDSGEINKPTAIHPCCELIVSGKKLLQSEPKADQQLLTTVNVYCRSGNGSHTSLKVPITVWRLPLSGKHALMLLVILGTMILLFLLILILICIWHNVTKKQGRRGEFHSLRAQELDTDTQGLNPKEEQEDQEEKAEAKEDEIFYATVNHAGSAGSSAVMFELGTDYATVVIN
ncbi:uncharacterized protein [Paramisgurnus dabryanus]|uniref:uncharacterized protein n=1 Tax=Paramisgurnus dabryanus TaxID=90735 RepID=UPI0031F44F9D